MPSMWMDAYQGASPAHLRVGPVVCFFHLACFTSAQDSCLHTHTHTHTRKKMTQLTGTIGLHRSPLSFFFLDSPTWLAFLETPEGGKRNYNSQKADKPTKHMT
uniref:Uncharacterized protein n=1 Tax=Micrurus lemniscatus lemniscatus TaxID=129467 RepID=A0A2D4JN48_MICLE